MVAEGENAPSFKLDGSDGRQHSLSDFKGKRVVLYFYPKDNTPGCTMEAKEFTEHLGEIHSLNAEVLGVSTDDFKSHCSFIEKQKLRLLLLSDPDGKCIKAYGSYGSRGIFGIGTLRKTFIIDENAIVRKVFDKVHPGAHAKEVINTLKAL